MIKHVSVFTLKDKMEIDHFITLLEEVGKVITEGGIGVTISSQSGWRMEQLTALEDEQLACTPTEELLDLEILQSENIQDTLHAYQLAKRCNEKRVMAESVKWGQRKARINAIAPGIIVTPLAIDEFNGPRGDFYKNMFAKCPVGRPGTADEVANVAELLMSDKGAFITGSTFLMDGGVTSSYYYGPLKPEGGKYAIFHTSEHHVPDGMNPLLLAMSVEHEIKERLATEWKSRVFSYLGNTLMLIELSSEDAIVQFTDSCDRFCKWAYRVMGAVVTAGIGRVCDNMANIKTSYDGAREAVSYRVLYGTKRAINIAELAPKEQETTLQPEDTRMHDLFKAIHLGLKEEIEKVVVNEIEKLHSNAQTVSQYNLAIMEMVGAFYRFCANNFLDFNDHLHGIQNPYETIPQMDESTLTAWMQEVSVELGEQLKNARNSTSRRLVTDAQNLVRERYMEPDLSLDTICSVLGVSNSYFSSVFKKETGKAFITYLTDYRMDHAATLILETNEKSYQIAERVGYLDANYFSYVFKKRFGVSPSKYRAQHTNQ